MSDDKINFTPEETAAIAKYWREKAFALENKTIDMEVVINRLSQQIVELQKNDDDSEEE